MSGFMTSAPRIETDRLILRAHRADDLAALVALWSEPDVLRYISATVPTEQECWFRLLRYAGNWALLGFGSWALEAKDGGAFIGELGFADYHRDIDVPNKRDPEIGWVLAPQVFGRGYASEAVRAVTQWGDRHLASARSYCIIRPDNLASVRVAEKCGYRAFTRTTMNGDPLVVLERMRPPA
jgi:RimJ/RimL family protein N-acetyltransferase